MNNVILDLIPKSTGTAVDGAASSAGTKSAGAIGAQLFRMTLADRLRTVATTAKAGKTLLVPAETATLKAVQTKISKLLASGASHADVVNALAAQLASSVAQTLEAPTDARPKLQTVFASALAPPGRGDPAAAPVADRSLALAQRFIRLANLADAIAGQPSGQQKRIAGNVLDAQRAKDIPAPTTPSDPVVPAIASAYESAPGLPANADADLAGQAGAAEREIPPHATRAEYRIQTTAPTFQASSSAAFLGSKPATRKQTSGTNAQAQTSTAKPSIAILPPAATGSSAVPEPAMSGATGGLAPAIPVSSGSIQPSFRKSASAAVPASKSSAGVAPPPAAGSPAVREPAISGTTGLVLPPTPASSGRTDQNSQLTGPVQTARNTAEPATGPAVTSPARAHFVALESSRVPDPASGGLASLRMGPTSTTNGSDKAEVRQAGLGTKAATSDTTSLLTRSVQMSGAISESRQAAPAKSPDDLAPSSVSASAVPDPATSGNDAGNGRQDKPGSKASTASPAAVVPTAAGVRVAKAVTERRAAVAAESVPQASSNEIVGSPGTVFPTSENDDGNDPKETPATSQTSNLGPADDAVVGLLLRSARLPNTNREGDGSKLKLGSKTATTGSAGVPLAGSNRAPAAIAERLTAIVPSSPDEGPITIQTPAPNASPASGIVPPEMIADGAAGAADARTVELGSKAAIATDGDTTLGRVLTRAAIAADARDVSAVPDDSSDSTPPATAAPTVAVKSIATPSAAITLFIKQFETALNADSLAGTPKLTPDDTPAATSLLPQSGHAAAAATQAFSPSVAPFTIERANVDAGSAPPAAASPADHSGIADQVLRGAFMRNVGQSSELRLTLAPSSLGDVTVKLVVNAGNVTAHVIAETPEVRDALVAAQPQLTKSLTDAGLKLTGFSVDLSGNGAGFAQQNNQPQNGNRSRSAVGSVETDDASDETLLEAIPSFGPSNVAGRNVRGYNYLA